MGVLFKDDELQILKSNLEKKKTSQELDNSTESPAVASSACFGCFVTRSSLASPSSRTEANFSFRFFLHLSDPTPFSVVFACT